MARSLNSSIIQVIFLLHPRVIAELSFFVVLPSNVKLYIFTVYVVDQTKISTLHNCPHVIFHLGPLRSLQSC